MMVRHDMLGTPRYTSVHCHAHRTPSRRDDIESLGYVLVLLATGPCGTRRRDWPHGADEELLRGMAQRLQRDWQGTVQEFLGEGGRVRTLRGVKVRWSADSSGRPQFKEIPRSQFELEADLAPGHHVVPARDRERAGRARRGSASPSPPTVVSPRCVRR